MSPYDRVMQSQRLPVAWLPLVAAATAVGWVLVLGSNAYGYHRDELYFLRAGDELAFGYPDQPPLTPLLARLAGEVFGGSLVGLRLLPAVAAGLVVLCTGLIARELGGDRAAQAIAAAAMAVSAILLAVGHLLSTSVFDVLAWTVLSWLLVRALRDGGRSWLWVGLVAGIGLQNKVLVAFLLLGLASGLVIAGPRDVLRSRWPWLAAAIALALWTPYLIWQADHGWPQLEISGVIASGGSGTSEPRWLFLPYQLVLVSPLLVPVWVAGLWRLATASELRRYRAFAAAYAVLAVVFIVSGGKPYYLAGLFPLLLAAGAAPTAAWVRRGAGRARTGLLAGALALSAAVSAVLFLPLVPAASLADTPIVDINYDAGETVGWPALVRSVAVVHAALPADERAGAVILTRNYGQAGAIDRYGPELGLPRAHSGHNGYADWGPPPERPDQVVVVVGYDESRLREWFAAVDRASIVDNGVGLDNDEQGTPVWVCRQRRAPWTEIWGGVAHLG